MTTCIVSQREINVLTCFVETVENQPKNIKMATFSICPPPPAKPPFYQLQQTQTKQFCDDNLP